MIKHPFRADLHCHSTFSDGTLTPKELLELAQANNLSALAITDHDTVDAYKEWIPLAKKQGFLWISGVEFSACHEEESVHILGYSFSLSHPVITELCQRQKKRRTKRNHAILALLNKEAMPLTEDELNQAASLSTGSLPTSIGRPHIALAMIKKGFVETIQEAFQKYIGNGKNCYVSIDPISATETIDVIHQAGGLAVIAHPHLIRNKRLKRELLKLNFDGIECFYGTLPNHQEKPWIQAAKERNWLISGGSDFHGSNKIQHLGCSFVDESHFKPFYEKFLENNS